MWGLYNFVIKKWHAIPGLKAESRPLGLEVRMPTTRPNWLIKYSSQSNLPDRLLFLI